MKFAMETGIHPDDPTIGVKRVKIKTTGYATWTEDDITRFETKHPIGTRARLALALLLYTGQRRSDVVRLGRQHIRGGVSMSASKRLPQTLRSQFTPSCERCSMQRHRIT